jgi:SNF2 family DNA or RNA helicase
VRNAVDPVESSAIVADVRPTDHLDQLVIVPRPSVSVHDVARALKGSLPQVLLRRFAGGFCISADDSGALLISTGLPRMRWTDEAQRLAENRLRARGQVEHVLENLFRIKDGGKRAALAYLNGVSGLEALDDHQWVNVAAMTLQDSYGLCLFDEQGAGKTVTLIHAFDVLVARDEMDFALIIAPKSMIPEWPRDFVRFKGDLYNVVIATGSRNEKLAALRKRSDVVVTNFETVSSMEAELRALLRTRGERAMLVVDESFHIKNLDAKRTRALRRLREFCARAYVLCGTPAPNSPHDLIQQFNIVDFGLTFSGVNVPDDRALAQPLVQEVIEKRGPFVRHLKKDVLPDLLGKRFNRVLVSMAPDQKKLYQSVLRNLIADLRSTNGKEFQRHLTSFLARRSALLQICSNPTAIAEDYNETPAKLQTLDELLPSLIEDRDEKVVIWSFYTASLAAIFSRYERFNPVRYDGTVTDVNVRRDFVRRFQEDHETMLFVGNPAAAGAGLTLHRARVAVYESMSNQAAHYLQSIDRIHRKGQTRAVEYVILLCNNTIELREYERLTEKESAAGELFGDGISEAITREAMLAELLEADALIHKTR